MGTSASAERVEVLHGGRSGEQEIFYSLEALRGFAALLIFFRHASDFTGLKLPSSHLAVDLFFVLSGFVMAHAYDRRFAAGLTPGAFMRLRLIRLYPLYILSIVAAVATVLFWRVVAGPGDWSAAHLVQAFALNSLFLPAPTLYGEAYPLNLPAWSLFLEVCACAAFAAFWRRLNERVLLAVVACAGLVLIGCGLHYDTLSLGWDWKTFGAGFARVLYSFPLGILLYRRFRGDRVLPLNAWIAPAIVVVLLCVAAGPWQAVYELVCVLLLMPVLVALAARTSASPAASRLFALLGVTSYALYVLHVPALTFVQQWLAYLGIDEAEAGPGAAAVLLLLLLAGCWALDRFYDVPARAWLKRRATSQRAFPTPDRRA